MSKPNGKKKKKVAEPKKMIKPSGKLNRFTLTLEPSQLSFPWYELTWRIVADGKETCFREKFIPDDFNSIIDYVTKNSYCRLRQYLGLSYREEL